MCHDAAVAVSVVPAGVNVWRSLRDVADDHLAWRHLNRQHVTGEFVCDMCVMVV